MDIENRIGQTLFDISPNKAKKIIMKSLISPENDHGKFAFSFLSESGREESISGSDIIDEMLKLLVELKQYYLDNNLTNGQPIWLGSEVSVDLEKMKIHFDMKYTEEEVEAMFAD